MYIKDFDSWSIEKQYIDKTEKELYFNEREVWWCAFGVNIGVEIDGKNGKFERPALILKYINKDMMIVVPLTTKGVEGKYQIKITTEKMSSLAKIAQIRVVSSKRLLRKIDTLSENQFQKVREKLIDFLL